MSYLSSFLPASVLSFLQKENNRARDLEPPLSHSYDTVVLFADVSGFTAMCEAMAAKGTGGDEMLAFHLNSYFELLIKTIASQGGDVFKYAGDALVVVWPPNSEEDVKTLTRRAAQCALEIKTWLTDAVIADGVRLNVKVGVGCGKVTILHLGGVYKRIEYLAIGDPLAQAFHSEHQATKREVVISPEAWELISPHFTANIHETGHAFIQDCHDPLRKINIAKAVTNRSYDGPGLEKVLRSYIPTAVVPMATINEDKWISELRRITVLFVNLGVSEHDLVNLKSDEDIGKIHEVLKAVQIAVYRYEGSLNKFLMDDKGSTLIAVFGLPPLAHQDDSLRGVLSALEICDALSQLDLRPSVGVTTGNAFCGIVGNKSRREYSVLGDTVNLSARLMQQTTKTGASVLCDTETMFSAKSQIGYHHTELGFFEIAQISVKGKSKPVRIFRPILKNPSKLPVSEAMKAMFRHHSVSVQNSPHGNVEVIKYQDHLLSTITTQKKPCAIILQSDYGLGKTRVMGATMTKFVEQHPHVPVVYGAGSSLSVQPLEAWVELFFEIFDVMIQDLAITNGGGGGDGGAPADGSNGNGSSKPSSAQKAINIRSFLRNTLAKHPTKAAQLAPYIPTLNQLLPLKFEESSATMDMDSLARDDKGVEVLVAIMEVFGAAKKAERDISLVVVIEDATNLDPLSWTLAHKLLSVEGLVIVLALRPMITVNLGAFSKGVAEGYQNITEHPNTAVFALERRSRETMLQVGSEAFLNGKDWVPSNITVPNREAWQPENPVVETLIELALGNPAVLTELVRVLVRKEFLTASATQTNNSPPTNSNNNPSSGKIGAHGHGAPAAAHVHPTVSMITSQTLEMDHKLVEEILKEKTLFTVLPPAPTVTLNAVFDRLHIWEQMVLKVAAVNGDVFDFSLIKQVFPLAAEDKDLTDALNKLLALGLIKEASPADQGEDELEDESEDEISESEKDSVLGGSGNTQHHAGLNSGEISPQKQQQQQQQGEKNNLMNLPDLKPVETSDMKRPAYAFVFPLLRASILGRLLSSHREHLEKALIAADPSKSKSQDAEHNAHSGGASLNGADKVLKESLVEGYLMKSGGRFQVQQLRYFMLFSDRLMYFKDNTLATTKGQSGGKIPITGACKLEFSPPTKANSLFYFSLTPDGGGRKYQLGAKTKEDADRWIMKINQIISEKQTTTLQVHDGSRESNHNNLGHRLSMLPGRDLVRKTSDLPALDFSKEKRFGESLREGYLFKRKKKRYFVLFQDKLLYYRNGNATSPVQINITSTTAAAAEPSDASSFSIIPELGGKKLIYQATDAQDAKAWLELVLQVAKQKAEDSKRAHGKIANHSVMEGYLRKKGGTLSSAKTLYFVLFDSSLQWFSESRDNTDLLGELLLYKDTIVEPEGSDPASFCVHRSGGKKYVLTAKDKEESEQWIAAIHAQAEQRPTGAASGAK